MTLINCPGIDFSGKAWNLLINIIYLQKFNN